MMAKITKVVVLPDIHAPRHDESSLRPVLEFVRYYKPDVLIQLGDLCDYDSIGRFDALKESDLVGMRTEVDSANEILDRIDRACPSWCEKILLEGNHDRRPETYTINNMSGLVKKLTGKNTLPFFHEAYNLKDRGWKWVRENKLYDIGKCSFTHGFFVNQYHASKTVHKWFRTIVYGHTHTFQIHTISGMDQLPVSAMSIGTLSRFDLSYMKGVPPDWCHMFMYMEFFGNGYFTPHPVTIINGQFCAGRVYGGKRVKK